MIIITSNMEKFYNYLKDKGIKFLKKEEIKAFYTDFKKLWNIEKSFDLVLDSLRKTKMTYIIDNYWAISKEDPVLLISQFLNFLNIPNYYGLETALYLNKKTWQSQMVYKILNTKYQKKRTINNIKFEFIKIPKQIYSDETIKYDNIPYSNYEKTILDLIFKKSQKFYEPENFDKINFYLVLYKKYPYVKSNLINNLDYKKRGLIR